MVRVIKCPSCSAPLECDGDVYEKCDFCGSQIAVDQSIVFSEQTAGFDGMLKNAHQLKDILRMVRSGNKIAAIKVYRETFGCSLSVAKNAVDRLGLGQRIDFKNVSFQTISPETAQKAIKAVGLFSGSMLLVGGLIIVFVLLMIGGVFWMMTGNFDVLKIRQQFNSTNSPANNVVPGFADEILRFGGAGTGNGEFTDNRVVAVDAQNRIYSGDYSGGRIQVFDKDGRFLTQWFLQTTNTPILALSVNRNGTVYIAQPGKISAYEGENGRLIKEIKTETVSDLTTTLEGRLIAVEGEKISVFDRDLKNLTNFAKTGEKTEVSDDLSFAAVNSSGEILAISRTGRHLVKFTPDGKLVDRFKVNPTSVHDLAVDPKGRIYIAETNRVWVYENDGKIIDSFTVSQCFGLIFNDAGELLTASRPFIVKYAIRP